MRFCRAFCAVRFGLFSLTNERRGQPVALHNEHRKKFLEFDLAETFFHPTGEESELQHLFFERRAGDEKGG